MQVADPVHRSIEAPAPPDISRGTHRALSRLGGLGAMLSGTVFLLTIGYTFGYLASLGLTIEMLDTPADLLPWIDRHTGAYLGLWWLYLLSLLLLLPAPLALYEPVARREKAWARIGAAAGVGGVLIGLVGVAVNATTAPILAAEYMDAPQASILLLSEMAGALGLHLRLFADVLFALWLGASGWVLVRIPGPWRAPGGAAGCGRRARDRDGQVVARPPARMENAG